MKWMVAPVAALAVMGSAPTAQASTNDFVREVMAMGLVDSEGPYGLAIQGSHICEQMDDGLSPAAVMMAYWKGNPALSDYQAGEVVGIAMRDMCPWHAVVILAPPPQHTTIVGFQLAPSKGGGKGGHKK